ncbi:PREDICTED: protein ALWAYS EARLY 3-like isoform X2 [Nelumbo nucifera]|uniref:Protein ALWAYS EARLY 3-like isoform X2 n=1 Tax=Nelumbo nucifera TaxID=4432 RepID=A0A1U7Z8Y6_NELNU|nr:PREDICTED: protein ALWAYS EARLY 3-like isoform X2 [Nelumbo nucifera]
MAPPRKSRSVNKRFSNVNEESPDKDGGNVNKSRQRKRTLSDMLGPQWSREELIRFYEAYRKYGKDWKKVAGVVLNRSVEMVEALYNINRAYLSLPEGMASVVGLIAMMTDHYNVLEGSDSERESNDASEISRKPQKRGRGKVQTNVAKGLDGYFPDLLNCQSGGSSYGCLSLLKKKRSGGSRPHAVGKRTPRFPVLYSFGKDRERYLSSNKPGMKLDVDAYDDEVAHEVALALAEASQKGGSPHVSHTPNRTAESTGPSSVHNGERMHADSEMTSAKLTGAAMDEDGLEGSLGSREAENRDFAKDSGYLMDTEGVGTVEIQRKRKRFHGKKPKFEEVETNHFDDVREACSGTEEGLTLSTAKGKVENEVTDAKIGRFSPQGPRKRSRQLFFGDENSALDALQTLADLSLMMPSSTMESESSVQFKEEKRTSDIGDSRPKISTAEEKAHQSMACVEDAGLKGAKLGRDSAVDVSTLSEAKQQSTPKMKSRQRKLLASKVAKSETHNDPYLSEAHKTEVSAEEEKKPMTKGKRTNQVNMLPKQRKSVKTLERSSSSTNQQGGNDSAVSTIEVAPVNQVSLPTKLRSRRKICIPKALIPKELRSSESSGNDQLNRYASSLHDKALDLKETLSHCLSSPMLRRWCAFEWFYSAIDYPWFAKREFVEYLNHVGLGHIPRLTRVEWGVIRSSLGKPRRLSEQFLREEKEKLEQYRESVWKHYAELRAGTREGLPTDLARPLSVGQRVISSHPKTCEIHDGSVLTVDRNRCRVQFDRPELGVEFVMDIDCMPLNPMENMPKVLQRQNAGVDKLCENINEPKVNLPKDWKSGGCMKFTPSENLEMADGSSQISSTCPLNTLLTQEKGDTINSILLAKAATSEIVNSQQATYTQPCTLAQIQAKEADIRALSELTRALDKKEALLLELTHMNDEVLENQKDGENSLKDSEPFKKQYATVLVQLQEANDQVSSALLYLRQRNTHQGNSPPAWNKIIPNSSGPSGSSSFEHTAFFVQESGSHVAKIIESSRLKAEAMVHAAMQVMSSLKEGEDAFARIGEALDAASNRYFGTDSVASTVRDPVNGSLACEDQSNSSTLEPTTRVPVSGQKSNTTDPSEAQIPLELISSCVSTLLMIQACTERQYPPAEVAQIIDYAVKSLQPCCSQNLPIYGEIRKCMSIVRNQILALVPT